MTKTIIITSAVTGLLVVALLFGLAALVGNTSHIFGAQVQNDLFYFTGGIKVGNSSQYAIDSSGNVTTSGKLTLGASGTALSTIKCATATYDPGSLAAYVSSTVATSVTSTDIALPGAVMGDICIASLTSSTSSSASVGCIISGTATSTLTLQNKGGSALDLASGTAKVCYIH